MHFKLYSLRKSLMGCDVKNLYWSQKFKYAICMERFIFTLGRIFKLQVFQIATVKFGLAYVWISGKLLGAAQQCPVEKISQRKTQLPFIPVTISVYRLLKIHVNSN